MAKRKTYYVKLMPLAPGGYARTVEADSPEAAEAMVRQQFNRKYGNNNLICTALEDAPPGRQIYKRRNLAGEREARVKKALKQIAAGDIKVARETV